MARTIVAAALALGLAAGCGARTDVDVAPERDGGLDAEVPDAGPDLTVDCGRRDRYSSPRRAVTLRAEVISRRPVSSQRWVLLERPPASGAAPSPLDGPVTTLVPDLVGDYLLELTVTDSGGAMAQCEVVVHSVVGPPVAICPEEEELTTPVDRSLTVIGDGYDDEEVVAYRWDFTEVPPGADPQLVPADEPVTNFLSDTPGRHLLRLTVTDRDGATDACTQVVRVTAPPVVTCPPGEILAPTRREVTVRAMATDDLGVAETRWELLERPPESTVELGPGAGEVIRFTPDKPGLYRLAFTAIDEEGLMSSCEVIVRATPTPPDALCPMGVTTEPLTTVELTGDGVDDGRIVGYRWELIGRPDGSSADPPSPPGERSTFFTPDVAGRYRIQLTVVDDDGDTGTCEFEVTAVPQEGLRVEVFWNPPDRSCDMPGAPVDCDDSDVDTHLLRDGAMAWFSTDDCHYANCNASTGDVLEWGAPGPDDNPRLDLDDTEGFGPENINVDDPVVGTYRVGVHLYDSVGFDARTDLGGRQAVVTVNIYCGMRSDPDRTFGPVTLTEAGGPDRNPFWRVADVEVGSDRCRITDLSDASGAPSLITGLEARRTR